MGLIWELLVFLNVVFTTFLFLTLKVSLFCPQAYCLLSLPMSSNCMFCPNYYPRPLSRSWVFQGYQSNMTFFPPRIISGRRAATLISVFCLPGQCLITGKDPDLVWETATPLPSIYPAHRVAELTLLSLVTFPDPPPPVSGDFVQVLRMVFFFFFQIETNLASLELKVLASCAPIGTKTPASSFQEWYPPSASTYYSRYRLSLFLSQEDLFFFFQARPCI